MTVSATPIPVWPVARIPLPNVEGYAITPGEALVRTDMESGAARARRRFTQTPAKVAVRWNLRPLTYAIFEAWFRHEAMEGAQWFEIELLGGIGLAPHQARFTKAYQARLSSGNLWEVSAELELRNRPMLTRDALGVLVESDFEALAASVDSLDILVHQQLPTERW